MRYSFKKQHLWMCEGDQAEYVIVFQKIKINQQRQIAALADGTCFFGLFFLGSRVLEEKRPEGYEASLPSSWESLSLNLSNPDSSCN